MSRDHDIRGRLAAFATAAALVSLATSAGAQKEPPGGGGGGAAGGNRIGDYRVSVFPMPYEPLSENARYFSNLSPTLSLWYYYSYGDLTIPAEFNFRYFGSQVRRVYAIGSGALGIGAGTNVYGNHNLPSPGVPSGTLAPFWDLLGGSSWDDYRPGVRWEITGEGDDQILKIEWHNVYNYYCYELYGGYYGRCEDAKHFTFAIWIHNAIGDSDSLIQYRYGRIVNPDGRDDGYLYDGRESGNIASFTIGGIESPDNAQALHAFACSPSCKIPDFPEDTMVQFGQGADLVAETTSGPLQGFAGVPTTASASLSSIGASDAVGFGAKLWVSADPRLDPTDWLLDSVPPDVDAPSPDPAGLFSAASDAYLTVDFAGSLPRDLDEGGSYYLLTEVDPASDGHPRGLVREDLETNNVGAFGPFPIGPPTPDLAVSNVTVDTLSVAPGGTLLVDWTAQNLGNLPADGVPYWVVLSVGDVITPSDTVIGTDFLRMDEISQQQISLELTVPPSTRPGVYNLGIVIDPENRQREIDDFNNVGLLEDLVLIGADGVSIATGTLEPGFVGAPYCQRLDAAGGNGTYVWTAKDPGALPPGLALVEEPADARAKGRPFESLLCGVPALEGSYAFDVSVTSAGKTASRELRMTVDSDVHPLGVVTRDLPSATFQVPYEAVLLATGGAPPYTWELDDDSPPLPRGVALRADGRFGGAPLIDGRFPLTVRVTDSNGNVARAEVYLPVTPPGRLTCVSQALDGAAVDSEYAEQLVAAGGNKPYLWSSVESRRLSQGTDPGETLPDVAPPGLVLAESGAVSGAPASAGSYVWTARVTDQLGQEDVCLLSVEFSTGALGVITAGVPVVCTDRDYSLQLEASGGDGGFLVWSLDESSTLPDGLELTPSGLLTGNVSAEVLEGNPSRVFNLTAHVRDSSNARGVGAVALRVQECGVTEPLARSIVKKTGCGSQAGSGAPAVLGLLALALLRHRRRR